MAEDLWPRLVTAAFEAQMKAERQAGATLHGGSGGGTSGDVTDDWKASVDRQLGQLHGDVRALLTRGVAAVVALALMIGGLYVRTDAKFESVYERLGRIEVQQQKLDDKIDTVAARLDGKLDVLIERSTSTPTRHVQSRP